MAMKYRGYIIETNGDLYRAYKLVKKKKGIFKKRIVTEKAYLYGSDLYSPGGDYFYSKPRECETIDRIKLRIDEKVDPKPKWDIVEI